MLVIHVLQVRLYKGLISPIQGFVTQSPEAPSQHRNKSSNALTSLADRTKSSTCAAECCGHFGIRLSLTDRITHLLPTRPGKCEQGCKRNERSSHPFPTAAVKCMAVIHHELDTSQIRFKKPAPLLVTEYPITASHRVPLTAAMLTGDKQAASGCTHAPVTACFIFFLSA